MKGPKSTDLDSHVTSLCLEHGIAREASSRRGRAFRGRGVRLIRIPPVKGRMSYLVALHELGHIVGRGRSAPKLECEANAWKWALERAIIEPTPANLRGIGRRLRSYQRWAARLQKRRKNPPRLPAPEHDFWRMAAWADLP